MPHPKLAGNYSGFVTAKKIDKSSNGFFQLVAQCKLLKYYDKNAGKEVELNPPQDITAYLMLNGHNGPNMVQCDNLLSAFEIGGKVDDDFLMRLHSKDVKDIPVRFTIEVAKDQNDNAMRLKGSNQVMMRVAFINSAAGFGKASEDVTKFLEGGGKGWMTSKFKPREKKQAAPTAQGESVPNVDADGNDIPF